MLRLPFVVLCVAVSSVCFCSALTLEEISLMLRAGYSSKTILEDISIQHFHGTFDAEAERDLIQLRASPDLIEALKSGKYTASESENRAKQESIEQQVIEAKRMARQAADRQARERAEKQSRLAAQQATAEAANHSAISDQSLLPSEKEALGKHEMLTASEMRFLTPLEKEALNGQKRAAKEAEDRAAYAAWCKEQPVACAQVEAAKSAAAGAQQELQSLKDDLRR